MNRAKQLYKRFIRPVVELRPGNIRRYVRFVNDRRRYRALGGTVDTTWPILGEDRSTHDIDPHYFFQGLWAARQVVQARPAEHVDVGSQTDLLGYLSTITNVTSVELRPISVDVPGLTIIQGSVTDMPFDGGSVHSLSCLHVAEHIGLGRYGDPLDPEGTKKACQELTRVLAPSGRLYFSVPIGRERTEFNAHRIHQPDTIIGYFSDLTLTEFSAVTDKGEFIANADLKKFHGARYALGLFRFTKSESA